jgi:hypothetical protein
MCWLSRVPTHNPSLEPSRTRRDSLVGHFVFCSYQSSNSESLVVYIVMFVLAQLIIYVLFLEYRPSCFTVNLFF